MLFYSEKINAEGEKDYLDTNDFPDVFFEKDRFEYIDAGKTKSATSECKLVFNEETQEIFFKATIDIEGKIYEHAVVIDPLELIDQGADVYYRDELLDDAEIIKTAKDVCLTAVKAGMLEDQYFLKGTQINVIGFVKNKNNTIGVVDRITIVDNDKIKATKNYSIISLNTVTSGTLEIILSSNKKMIGVISSVESEGDGALVFNLSTTETIDCPTMEYKNVSEFKTMEEYQQDRATYISVGDNVEEEFDEFDDLF